MQSKQALSFSYLEKDTDHRITLALRDPLLNRITQNFNQSHATDVVKRNGATFKQGCRRGGRDAERSQSGGFEVGNCARQIIRLIAQVVDDTRRVAQGKLVHWARGITGPYDLYCRMSCMGAKLQVDVLRRVEDGFAELVAERADKFTRLIRSPNG
jgi:hypothetical protein